MNEKYWHTLAVKVERSEKNNNNLFQQVSYLKKCMYAPSQLFWSAQSDYGPLAPIYTMLMLSLFTARKHIILTPRFLIDSFHCLALVVTTTNAGLSLPEQIRNS